MRGGFESDVGYAVAFEEENLIASCDQDRGAYDVGPGDSLFRDGVEVWLLVWACDAAAKPSSRAADAKDLQDVRIG